MLKAFLSAGYVPKYIKVEARINDIVSQIIQLQMHFVFLMMTPQTQ